MRKTLGFFRSQSVGFIIISSCVAIVLALVVSIVLVIFTGFQTSTREAVYVQTRELSAQIVYNYQNYISGIIDTSNIVQTDVDRYDLDSAEGRQAFSAYLGQITRLRSGIIKIAVYDFTTERCRASSDEADIGAEAPGGGDGLWFREAAADPTVHAFSAPYIGAESGDYTVNISKLIKLQNGAVPGVLKIEISFQNFIELVERSNLGASGHITIISADYSPVYSSLASGATPEEMTIIRQVVLGSANAVIGGHSMAVNVDTLSNTKWRICVFINIDRLGEIQQSFLMIVIAVSIAVMVVGILLFITAARLITSPMKQLEQAMRKVEKSDYFHTEELHLVASKEVAALTRRFNKMMTKISELMERVITEQKAQRRSELKSLQNQINPHFLYNTLDSILWLVENKKNDEAGQMVVALARLFRIGVSREREVIPLRDEIEHVRNYLLIQNIRYVNSFRYTFDVQEESLQVPTMKLILQPIVENCIYHGLKNKIEQGVIHISSRIEDGFLVLSVADNGYGMRQETVDALHRSFQDGVVSESVGLKNIYQRVMIYYGGRASMQIESVLDEGTTVTIREPLGSREETDEA